MNEDTKFEKKSKAIIRQHSYVILVGQWKTKLANVQESARVMRILKLTPMSCDAKLIPDWWILAIWLFAGPVIIKRTMHIRFQISSYAISSLLKYQWTCKTTIHTFLNIQCIKNIMSFVIMTNNLMVLTVWANIWKLNYSYIIQLLSMHTKKVRAYWFL